MSGRETMARWQRIYVASCAWIIGFALTYSAAELGEWPKLTYFPLARKWELWTVPPGPLPMPYVGLILWGLGGGAVIAATAWLISRFAPPLSDRLVRLLAAWTLSAFVFAGLFFTWNLFPF